MKALSLAQPMASAIFALPDESWKRVENRQRKDGRRPANILNHRGPLLIHASNRWVPEHWEWIAERGLSAAFTESVGTVRPHTLPRGRILGVVEVIGEVGPDGMVTKLSPLQRGLTAAERSWWMQGFGLVFGARRSFPAMRTEADGPAMWPALSRPGALGLFNVDDHIAGGAERCTAWSTTKMPGPLARCVFGVGHSCPHADVEGFGWT